MEMGMRMITDKMMNLMSQKFTSDGSVGRIPGRERVTVGLIEFVITDPRDKLW